MNAETIIIKSIDCENYTYIGVFSRGFAFDIEIVGCDFLVSFYNLKEGVQSQKIYDLMLQFELDDVHDYIRFIREDDYFLSDMSDEIQSWIENEIAKQLSEGKTIIDLTKSLRNLMEDMTMKAKAHLDVILAQDKENRLYDNPVNEQEE